MKSMSVGKEKKGGEFVPRIVAAVNKEDAMTILNDIATALHINDDFNTLRALKDELDGYTKEFKAVRDSFKKLSAPYNVDHLQDLRRELSFIYAALVDSDLVYQANRLKIQYENTGKTAKAESYMAVKANNTLLEEIGKSQKAIEMAAGTAEAYVSWSRLSSTSYGIFCSLRELQEAIRLVSHAISSLIQSEINVSKNDLH